MNRELKMRLKIYIHEYVYIRLDLNNQYKFSGFHYIKYKYGLLHLKISEGKQQALQMYNNNLCG